MKSYPDDDSVFLTAVTAITMACIRPPAEGAAHQIFRAFVARDAVLAALHAACEGLEAGPADALLADVMRDLGYQDEGRAWCREWPSGATPPASAIVDWERIRDRARTRVKSEPAPISEPIDWRGAVPAEILRKLGRQS